MYNICMKKFSLASALLLLPIITHAQTLHALFKNITTFLSTVVIPFLLAMAFLFFAFNAFRFFILNGSNEQGREKAKALAIYGIAAFVLIIVFWGVVNLLSKSIGYEGKAQPKSDYITEMGG